MQIAAFALALTAWRIGGMDTNLPTPHVAWVGSPPPMLKPEFVTLANGDVDLRRGLEALHDLFAQAPLLGSLIEITGGDLVTPTRIARIEKSVTSLLGKISDAEPERAEGALAARGMADAASILARRFVLQATNVPFLGRGKQDATLSSYIAARFEDAKADLATAMLTRMRALALPGGTVTAVTPQNWLFLGSYKKMRQALLSQASLRLVAILGEHAFDSAAAAGAFTGLVVVTEARADATTVFAGLDANDAPDPEGKASVLGSGKVRVLPHLQQLGHPDSMIAVVPLEKSEFLTRYASCYQGTSTSDNDRCVRQFWEIAELADGKWKYFAGPPDRTANFRGMSAVVDWITIESGVTNPAIRGKKAWDRVGLIFGQMRDLPSAQFMGEKFGNSSPVLIVHDDAHLPAVAEFVWSGAFLEAMRTVNKKVSVDNGYITKVPFDLPHWLEIAAEKYPAGLPEPYSNDPTQWIFHGHPRFAEPGMELQAALVRLAGYRWPAETDSAMRLSSEARARIGEVAALPDADAGGLLALVPVLGERPLADRLRAYCAATWGDAWQAGTEAALIAAACERTKDKPPKHLTLEAWLSTHAARQHAKLFHERPLLWWITDGRVDGFTVVAEYHRLTRTNLERLAYTVLGDWITRLGNDPRAEAARVLQIKLGRILEGENPYDIFVRWKPLARQPLGWDPDFNDGVRLNIRPFLEAGVLTHVPNVKYGVDGGKDVRPAPWFATFEGERRNDHHTTLEQKRAARAAAAA